jgi:hypothetical protein
MIKVYIASAYTKGDVAVNVKNQLDIANQLIEAGFAPFAPLYSHFQHMAHPQPYEVWTRLDNEWCIACDCLLRFDKSDSKGADAEIELAKAYDIPVFYSMKSLVSYYGLADKANENWMKFPGS